MSILGNRVLGGAGQQPYTVGRSLRFRASASAYLNRTFTSAGNRKTWTWSGWVKKCVLGSANDKVIFGSYTDGNNIFTFSWRSDAIFFDCYIGGALIGTFTTTQVFRDPSAWYHVVLSLDTTQATNTNRIKLYINGVQVTAFSSITYPSQNADLYVNAAVSHLISANPAYGTSYTDQYLAEVNFIDGQALTPSSFGAYDNNGVWQPRKYGGTYGTNGFYLPFNTVNTTTQSFAGNFNGTNQFINVAASASLAPGTGDFTIEANINLSALPGTNGYAGIFENQIATTAASSDKFLFAVQDVSGVKRLVIIQHTTGATAFVNWTPTVGTWYHVAAVRQSGTILLFINGVQQTVTNNTILNGVSLGQNGASIGAISTPFYFNGYISNARYVVGTAVYTTGFTPPSSNLTAVANTQWLTLQNSTLIDNSSAARTITNNNSVTIGPQFPFQYTTGSISSDASGNGNNWTANNINSTFVGVTYDSMIDSPTVSVSSSNYATLNPLRTPASTTISNGNLSMSDSTNNHNYLSTIGMTSGKWYFEFVASASGFSAAHAGIAISTISPDTYIGSDTNGYAYHATTGQVLYNNSALGNYSTWTAGDVIGIAYDANGGNLYVAKNNTWQNSGNPAAGTGAVATGIASNTWFFGIGGNPSALLNANFGQQPFTYTPPTGYSALNTYNLPQPTIMNGANYMAATIWSGDGAATRLISNGLNNTNGVVFQPDFVWLKTRNIAYSPLTYDLIRGVSTGSVSAALYTNGSSAEGGNDNSTYGYLSGFNQNGFTVTNGSYGSGTYTNGSGYTYVAWQWNAGSGVTSTNTTGFVSSQVSVNPTAGFSVINYSGNGSNSSVGHSLGVAPNMIIVKSRSNAQDWVVYHSSLGTGKYILLSSTAASVTDANYFTSVTSSAFSMTGSATSMNTNSATYMAYCWSAVAGYSAFGSYTGNASADGPFVYTGFRPRFIMVRRTDAAGFDWAMMDTSRDSYNVAYQTLWANLANAEYTTTGTIGMATDILSNGFKIRGTNTENNASGGTYIYAAFAENPFKVSRAR